MHNSFDIAAPVSADANPASYRLAADSPLRLDAIQGGFVVIRGFVDLFAIALAEGEPDGARRHLLRVEVGGLVRGLPGAPALAVLGVGGLETEIRYFPTGESLAAAFVDADSLLDKWISSVAEMAFGGIPAWPEGVVGFGDDVACGADTRLFSGRGVAWVEPLDGAFAIMTGDETFVELESGGLPLAAGLALLALVPSRYTARATVDLAASEMEAPLARFHQLAVKAIGRRVAEFEAASQKRLTTRESADETAVARAIARLARVGEGTARALDDSASADPVLRAFAAVAREYGATLPALPRTTPGTASLRQLARLTGFGFRQVLLREAWWRAENGPLIGQRADDQRPVALLSSRPGIYRLVDEARETIVTAEVAAGLSPEAVMLYPPLPDRVLNLRDIARLALSGARRDLSIMLGMSLLSAMLGALVPIATGFLFEWVVPRAELNQLAAVIIGLALAVFGAGSFELVKSVALVRLEARMEGLLQPAVMQRLLSLPVGFFRNFGTGDLTDRILGVQRMRRMIAGTTVVSLLSTGFAVVGFAVILIYSGKLALLALGVVCIGAFVTVILNVAQLRQEREAAEIGGREDGLILQMIQGIGKLRVSASEPRLFGIWAGIYTRRRTALVKGQRFANLRAAFYGIYPIAASLLLYRFASGGSNAEAALGLGAFLAVSTAFGQLLAATVSGGDALAGILGALPLFERLRPVVTAAPEGRADKADPGPLTGTIELSGVSFRYAPDAPLILDDLSLRIEPGEFVAIVGPSGSGKSTLQRLLLGFETPESGDILYQGRSIGGLDASALRRRIGVVLQNARIMSGSIFENITAGLPYSLEEAWEAARMAGIAEEIEAMPMGMHSLLMEGATTLSGGQLQRVVIARALIGKPQVLIFDEATSALDNASQAVVTASLNRLHATRIVIAHRLSTIREADRIYVMDRGRIVESGDFQSLMDQGGAFATLASRQIL
jgi:NHLM bacteriocin system ABC transporter ATP-binding protein